MVHGAKAISNVPLSYVVYKDGSEADKAVQTVSETYTGTIEPGATIEYTFQKKADLIVMPLTTKCSPQTV